MGRWIVRFLSAMLTPSPQPTRSPSPRTDPVSSLPPLPLARSPPSSLPVTEPTSPRLNYLRASPPRLPTETVQTKSLAKPLLSLPQRPRPPSPSQPSSSSSSSSPSLPHWFSARSSAPAPMPALTPSLPSPPSPLSLTSTPSPSLLSKTLMSNPLYTPHCWLHTVNPGPRKK